MDNNGSERIISSDHMGMGHEIGSVDAAGSSPGHGAVKVDTVIIDLTTSPVKVGKVNVADIQIRVAVNTFECLAICDDAGTLEVSVERDPSKDGVPTIPVVSSPSLDEFSNTSPICETFKHIKGIDELDLLALPFSKKKLKKLKKQKLADKSAIPSSVVDTISHYIMEID